MAKRKHQNNAPLKQIKGQTILYLEVIKIGVEGDDVPLYHKGRITHQLSFARRNFANFEKIHGDFMAEREITPYTSEILIRPWGAKVVNGEIIITGEERDKLEPIWIEFQMDKSTREIVLRES